MCSSDLFTEEELLARMAAGEPSGTDWDKVNSLTDEDIDRAMQDDPDAVEIDDAFWENAVYVTARGKHPVSTNTVTK